MNYYVERIQQRLPKVRWIARHIAGVSNLTDGMSRGDGQRFSEVVLRDWLAGALGRFDEENAT